MQPCGPAWLLSTAPQHFPKEMGPPPPSPKEIIHLGLQLPAVVSQERPHCAVMVLGSYVLGQQGGRAALQWGRWGGGSCIPELVISVKPSLTTQANTPPVFPCQCCCSVSTVQGLSSGHMTRLMASGPSSWSAGGAFKMVEERGQAPSSRPELGILFQGGLALGNCTRTKPLGLGVF